MTQDNIHKFTEPNSIHKNYRRTVIYEMTKYQLDLFTIIMTFPDNVLTVKDKQKALIMFLDKRPEFQSNNYITIWFKIAHEFYKNNYTKILIENVQFQKAQRCVNNNNLEMSFSNLATNPLQQSGQVQHANSNYSIEYPDESNESDDAIKSLCYQLKSLAIE